MISRFKRKPKPTTLKRDRAGRFISPGAGHTPVNEGRALLKKIRRRDV